MKSLIIPICGKSTRFPNTRPKWMLTHPKGDFMVVSSILGLNLDFFDKIYFVALKKHEEEFHFIKGLTENLSNRGLLGKSVITLLDEETSSQPHTVSEAITINKIEGYVFVKDCDNYFSVSINNASNSIAYCSLTNFEHVNPNNKSYIRLDDNNTVENIIEKTIISTTFCCGGYGFESAKEFQSNFKKLNRFQKDIYISDIVYQFLLKGLTFFGLESSGYKDWGTIKEWREFQDEFKTIFIDMDGTLVENSSNYFPPYIGTSAPITKNVEAIKNLAKTKNLHIIITTSRPERYRTETENELFNLGIEYNTILMGLPHCERIVINDFGATNPFPSCSAVNIERNSATLDKYV